MTNKPSTRPLDPEDDCPEWGEWWPEALEQRELDNADSEVSLRRGDVDGMRRTHNDLKPR